MLLADVPEGWLTELVLSDHRVLWVAPEVGAIRSVGKTGGPVVDVVLGSVGMGCLAVFNETMYWVDGGEIRAADTDGNSVRTLASIEAEQWPGCLAADAQWLYAADVWAGSILRIDPDTGASTVLAQSDLYPQLPQAAGGTVYWLTVGYPLQRLGAGETTPIGLGVPAGDEYAVTEYGAYWFEWYSGDVSPLYFASHDGLPEIQPVTHEGSDNHVDALAVDGVRAYWVDGPNGKISSAPLAGGAGEALVVGELDPSDLAVDDHSMYWISRVGIRKAVKPPE